MQSERLHGRVVGRVEVGVGPWREVAAADVGAPDAVVEAGVAKVAPTAISYNLTVEKGRNSTADHRCV